jgi:hypothetical protein
VRDGLVSLARAQEVYGVAIDPQTMKVGEAETRRLRSS